jgi:DNA topoisomerase-1
MFEILFTQKENQKMKKLKNTKRTCKVDGFEEEIQNPMVECPAVFIGKGDNPLNGRIKHRILPEMVTVNCSE